MQGRLINIGYGNFVPADRIIVIIGPDSAPMKRLREDAKEAGRLIDATLGHKTRSIIVMDSNHIVLSAIQPDTLNQRYTPEDNG